MKSRKNIIVPFNSVLNQKDKADETYGCRHTNPDICSKHSLPGVCAFVRPDNICKSPSNSWKKQFLKLFNKKQNV